MEKDPEIINQTVKSNLHRERERDTGDRLGFVLIGNFYNDRRHELDGESDNVNPGPISELRGLIRTPPYSQRS